MAESITPHHKAFIYSGFRLQENGLIPLNTPTKQEWLEYGRFLRHAEASAHFWIGDWLRYGEAHFKQDYTEAIELTGYNCHTLRRDKYLSERIPLERRRSNLEVAIHHEVAPLEPHLQELLFDKIATDNLTVQQLRMEKHRLTYETTRGVTQPAANTPGLLLGDCRELLHTIPNDSADCIITDPPYGLSYVSEHKIIPDAPLANDGEHEALEVLDDTLALVFHKLKDNSHVYIFSSWKTYPQVRPVVAQYFTVKSILVWEKNNWTAGDLEANYGQIHEFIIFAHKGRRHLNGRRDASVLHFDRVPENTPNRHSTEKLIKLLEYLITKSTQSGGTIQNPFLGSCTTSIVAQHYSDFLSILISLRSIAK